MHKFVRTLITEWRKLELPLADAAIVVAVSGGADSLSLLSAVHDLVLRKKLDVQLIVAHFNHKLRGRESDADEMFVREFADGLRLTFVSGRSKGIRKGNVEQNARIERYKFLESVALESSASLVLTAHTMNDQAETVLLNLIRGSGVDGLSGMRAFRDLTGEVKLARPLLSWATRTDTEGYCNERGIEFRQDRMNEDQSFTRVRIRKTVIPLLSDLNPKIVDTLVQTAELMRHASASASSGVLEDAPELKHLRTLSKSDRYRELRAWLARVRGGLRGIQLKHIEAIENLVLTQKSGKTVEIPGHGRVVKHGGRLVFSNIKVEK